jgi:DNA-binding beta-propeller fold protein YncE
MTILDTAHDNVEQELPTGNDPAAGAFTRDSSVMFLANAGDGFVTAFDLGSRSVLSTVHVGVSPQSLALIPDERFLAVADSASGSLAILRASPLALVTTVPVGGDPVDVIVPGWKWNN